MDSESRRRTNVKIDLSRKKGGVIESPLIVKKSTVTPLPLFFMSSFVFTSNKTLTPSI